ncbi:hypothetical protein K440DRAFT_617453 [Wilcoxina mikolae CBS 423.85]|nr:hypothetical protein K440DRAFT_617453 [Wilcoxina mikolae CBS 423.85]
MASYRLLKYLPRNKDESLGLGPSSPDQRQLIYMSFKRYLPLRLDLAVELSFFLPPLPSLPNALLCFPIISVCFLFR